ncbi:ABC transporter ATP-binding protein [Paenibacillus xylanilyticus]|uniref:ABC transporter ATP-binding protein n=1 Tax=Paenibacillus xylanilyticus TaxID=248903 RepID=A0A7Y6EW47_9BACL|nr:ABC transporter ATP-binding protein [Paenibacillus xylanilyticus]NUU77426.1 ABC transporter ATP-binding protein [Paenibacillus xylanilyticus]
MSVLLGVDRLSVTYKSGTPALQNVSFAMNAGEIVGIVGESGSGKSTLLRALLGMLSDGGQYAGGDIVFQGKSIFSHSQGDWSHIRGKRMAMVFQDSGAYLNPIRKVGSQYIEAIRTHFNISKKAAHAMAVDMLSQMGLDEPDRMMNMYPGQLSGGMKQRTAIAMAVTMEPELLLADEPTSALDVTTQVEVMKRLTDLRARQGTGMIIVTHNIAVAAHMADHIGVMQHGALVEFGQTSKIITDPRHEYTRRLLDAVPELEGNANGK